jgi:hypothetical protein
VIPVARLLALWLAAFWLPLTMHCELAELKGCCDATVCCADDSCCSDAHHCCADLCKIIEKGNYRTNEAPVLVPMASMDWIDLLESIDFRSYPDPAVALNEATGAPPGLSRGWHLVFRTAPAPRAPSAFC